jgi:hypothetical protein
MCRFSFGVDVAACGFCWFFAAVLPFLDLFWRLPVGFCLGLENVLGATSVYLRFLVDLLLMLRYTLILFIVACSDLILPFLRFLVLVYLDSAMELRGVLACWMRLRVPMVVGSFIHRSWIVRGERTLR